MNTGNKTFASGCLVWLVLFFMLSSLLGILAILTGSITSTIKGEFVAHTMQPLICPSDSTAEIVTYQSTILDENGTRLPSTAYELQCVSITGAIVKEPSPVYAFYWTGMFVAVAILASAFLALLLTNPVTRLVRQLFKSKHAQP